MTWGPLQDMETCYKVFRKEVLEQIKIEEDRFGFEQEITAKIAKIRPRVRIFEVGISYYGRTYEDGKKLLGETELERFMLLLSMMHS